VEIHRIRCAKSLTDSTLHQYGARASPLCDVCGKHGDVIHYLDECEKFVKEREEWRRAVNATLGSCNLKARMSLAVLGELVDFVAKTANL